MRELIKNEGIEFITKTVFRLSIFIIAIVALTSCEPEEIYIEGETVIQYETVTDTVIVSPKGALLDANVVGRWQKNRRAYEFNYDGTFKYLERANGRSEWVIVDSGDWSVNIDRDYIIFDSGVEISYLSANRGIKLWLSGIRFNRWQL